MKDMKITFSDAAYDYAAWMHQKSSNVLHDLCCMLRDVPSLKENDRFLSGLGDALKMYALCNGNLNGIYCSLVFTLLLEHNISGYQYLSDLIHGTEGSSIMQDILQNQRNERILELIEENKRENRSAIAEYLGHMTVHNRWTQQIAEDIEYVHNGERTWDWFYTKHSNDRNTFKPHFSNDFFRSLYEYFQSDDYKYADNDAGIVESTQSKG